MSAGAYEDDGDTVIEMDLLPPRWLDIQDEVTEYLADIAGQTRKLEQLHQKHILPGFDDEDVKKREERDIEKITQQITHRFIACQKSIKRIDVMVRESKQSGGLGGGDETMAQNLKISLATRVGEASALFRKKQSTYLKSKVARVALVDCVLTRADQNCAPWAGLLRRLSGHQRQCRTLTQRRHLWSPSRTDRTLKTLLRRRRSNECYMAMKPL